MAKPIVLCADSTCDLSPELIEKYNVHVIPMHVNLDGNTYADGVDIDPDAIYAVYREKKVLPTTAALNMDEFMEFTRPFIEAGNDVICLTLGSALSTTYNNCRLASLEMEGLYAIDSNNLSTGFGHLVIAAAERIRRSVCGAGGGRGAGAGSQCTCGPQCTAGSQSSHRACPRRRRQHAFQSAGRFL